MGQAAAKISRSRDNRPRIRREGETTEQQVKACSEHDKLTSQLKRWVEWELCQLQEHYLSVPECRIQHATGKDRVTRVVRTGWCLERSTVPRKTNSRMEQFGLCFRELPALYQAVIIVDRFKADNTYFDIIRELNVFPAGDYDEWINEKAKRDNKWTSLLGLLNLPEKALGETTSDAWRHLRLCRKLGRMKYRDAMLKSRNGYVDVAIAHG